MGEQFQNINARSEQIQDIIERMPTRFGYWVSSIVIILFCLLLVAGFTIEYPDTVIGNIVINSKAIPIKLISNSSGKLELRVCCSKTEIKEDEYIAVIQNPANTSDVVKIKSLLSQFSTNSDWERYYLLFPNKVSLGDINLKYYGFLNALKKIYDYRHGNIYEKQEKGIKAQLDELDKQQANNKQLQITKEKNMLLYKKMLDRDSALFSEKAATEAEVDNSKASFLNSKESFQNIIGEINNTNQKIKDVQSKSKQLSVEKSDEEGKMKLDLLTAFDDLKDNIKSWEQRYVFKSPFDGSVEFLKFWSNNQYIQSGEEAFSVIPKRTNVVGHMNLPSHGAGKVKVGQSVIIRLDNYPFEEFGSIKGKVLSISYSTNTLKASNQNNIDAYLVEVGLREPVETNYGVKIDTNYQLKGSGEIVTRDRKLIMRFFDNLRGKMGKNLSNTN